MRMKYIICHELAHALGIIHEQSRSARDTYVTINYANILSGYEPNFDIVPGSLNKGSYDFDSFMHYPQNAFSSNGQNTITTQSAYSSYQTVMGQRTHLSTTDKSGMDLIYGDPVAAGALSVALIQEV